MYFLKLPVYVIFQKLRVQKTGAVETYVEGYALEPESTLMEITLESSTVSVVMKGARREKIPYGAKRSFCSRSEAYCRAEESLGLFVLKYMMKQRTRKQKKSRVELKDLFEL